MPNTLTGSSWIWRGNEYTVIGEYESPFGATIVIQENGSENKFVQRRKSDGGWTDPEGVVGAKPADVPFIVQHEKLHAMLGKGV